MNLELESRCFNGVIFMLGIVVELENVNIIFLIS